MEELKKVYMYRSEEEAKPIINDSDLQFQMIDGQVDILFKRIYNSFMHEDSLSLSEAAESNKTLHELEGTYTSLREIHDQLAEVYQELLHAQNKE
ncbi:hypothetical protein PHSC3_000803 [Chlamydiales bacterium STE3]|nr:hypothetical protein PHSC3_000803 [Chlamydiales bacterium STE3]